MKLVRPTFNPALLAVLLVVVTGAVYWPVRQHGFVSYDDPEYVTGNRIVQAGLTWPGVKWAFTTGWTSYWHPLTWLSHMADAALFGPGPTGPHLVNVLLHLANTLILFGFLHRTTGARWRSVFVAALFALHPLHVESVAWVSERKDVLSAFFFLLTLSAYANYAKPRAGKPARPKFWYGCALLLFAFGLMSKPMVVTLPCVLLLLDCWPLQRFPLRSLRDFFSQLAPLLKEKIPFFLLSAAVGVTTFLIQRQNGAVQSLTSFSLRDRIENALVAYASYLGKTFWPANLAVFYPHPGRWPMGEVLLALIVVAGATLAAFWVRRRFLFVAVGWLWFLGMLVPAIGVVQVGDQAMADRYTYLPLLGVFIALVWGGTELVANWRWPKTSIAIAGALVVAACAVCTEMQLRHWQDSESLFRHAISVTEKNFVAHNNLGNALLEKGQVDDAITHLEAAINLRPDYAPPHNNLGLVLLQLGRPDEAVAHFRKALEAQPRFAEIHNNLGNALRAKGERDEAISEYKKAAELRPGLAVAHRNLGDSLLQVGRPDDAIEPLRKALELEPEDAVTHGDLGLAYLQTGRPRDAIVPFQAWFKLRPNSAEARYHLALALFQNGRLDEAIAHFQKVAEAQPANAEVQNNLGWALLQRGQCDEAIACFQTVLKIQPNVAVAHHNLAIAFLRKGQTRDAIAHYRSLLEREPDNARVLSDLAWVLATSPDASLRDSAQAIALAQRANRISGSEDATILRSLAAAYADGGQLNEAVTSAHRAWQLASSQADPQLAADLQSQIKIYQAGSPFRDGQIPRSRGNEANSGQPDAAQKNL